MTHFSTAFSILFLVYLGTELPGIECEGKLRIFPSDSHVNFPQNKPVTLECNGIVEPPNFYSNFKWIDPKRKVCSSVEKLPGGLSLVLLSPTIDDSGVYNCTCEFSNTETLSQTIEINFYKEITFDNCPVKQEVILGEDNQRVICKVSSDPGPKVSWSKLKPYNILSNTTFESDGFTINGRATENAAGVYRIKAFIPTVGHTSFRDIEVRVIEPPKIIQASGKELMEGKREVLECHASGAPSPIFTWFDSQKRNLSQISGYVVDQKSGILVINEVHRKDDSGPFVCEVTNSAGKDKKSVEVTIISKPSIVSFHNASFDEAKDGVIQCRSRGSPRPDLIVKKIDQPVVNSTGKYEISTSVEGDDYVLTVLIKNVNRADDGLYLCEAKNKAGYASTNGHIQVRFKPVMRNTTPKIYTWKQRPVNLTCIAESIPNATIEWYSNGQLIQQLPNSESQIHRIHREHGISILTVTPVSNRVYGNYVCKAKNELGASETSIYLEEGQTPVAPFPQFENFHATYIEISFNDQYTNGQVGLPVNNYIVKYNKLGHVEALREKVWPFSGSTYRLDGLVPEQSYEVQFAAENAVGTGEFSNVFNVKTSSAGAPEKPTIIDYKTNNGSIPLSDYGNSYSIKWTKPDDNGLEIDRYSIKYYKVENRFDNWISVGNEFVIEKSASGSLEFHLQYLDPNSHYRVELRSHNSQGYSKPFIMIFQTNDGTAIQNAYAGEVYGGFNIGSVVAVASISLIVLLVVMDAVCYFTCHVGVIYAIHNSFIKNDKMRLQMDETEQRCIVGDTLAHQPILRAPKDSSV